MQQVWSSGIVLPRSALQGHGTGQVATVTGTGPSSPESPFALPLVAVSLSSEQAPRGESGRAVLSQCQLPPESGSDLSGQVRYMLLGQSLGPRARVTVTRDGHKAAWASSKVSTGLNLAALE